MVELRVLNGYHRGAAMPLRRQDEVLSIGAAEDADMVLADPGIKDLHAELSLTADGWRLSGTQGVLRAADSNQVVEVLTLALGEFARVDHIWLTVVDEHSPWQDPPVEPKDAEVVPDDADAFGPGPAMQEDSQDAATQSVPDTGSAGTQVPPAMPVLVSRKRVLILLPLALTAVLSAAAAYAMTRTYTPLEVGDQDNAAVVQDAVIATDVVPIAGQQNQQDRQAQQEMARMAHANKMDRPGQKLQLPSTGMTRMPLEKLEALAGIGARADVSNGAEKNPALPPVLSQDQLRAAFRKRLEDVDLLRRFNLQLDDRSWSMQAALNEEDSERFSRMLSAFIKKYAIDFPVNVKIGTAEAMLPFKIQQVISGTDASIVTDDGRRLYVGDEYRGMKLAGIEGNQLSFTGKHSINVSW